TLARMASAKANALRKPIRWFSVPQLFRYERQQKGRLREHFQLNVDIIGEADVTADAELLAVAIEIMRACGLSSSDVRARVSDRRLLRAILATLGVSDDHVAGVFAVVDKFDRQPREISAEKLSAIGMTSASIESLLALLGTVTLDEIERLFGGDAAIADLIASFRRYFSFLDGLDVLDWVTIDLKIVRGLAYYTGIVFELFDARGEMRAICGGGRYDNLLMSLGGVDLPALGFGMGDVVLSDLVRERGLFPGGGQGPQVWVVSQAEDMRSRVLKAATVLRRNGVSVEYPLRSQQFMKQIKAAASAGAARVLVLNAPAEEPSRGRRTWTPDVPAEWDALLESAGL
ncbi:MAG TPA: ATP phosphoribosyltransferase regulatory subunit, partial [Gemmatimonadaceae bacterium]|nr:ATP phosphoribosyltransferase regulatory subunit [Gemmatimonadaceae bacterium]